MLTITLKSFSYKKGIPYDTSGNGGGFVFDCRAIYNPGRKPEFKKKSGLDKEIIDFLDKTEDMQCFIDNAYALIRQSVATYKERDFKNLMICFGCTGGQHRSVYSAQKIADRLNEFDNIIIDIDHFEKNNWPK